MLKRRIDDLGRIVIPKEIRKELNLVEGDEMEITLVDGVITISKHIEIEVPPICGLTLQKIFKEGEDFNHVELYRQTNSSICFFFIIKRFVNKDLSSTDSGKLDSIEDMESFVRSLIKEGFEIL